MVTEETPAERDFWGTVLEAVFWASVIVAVAYSKLTEERRK